MAVSPTGTYAGDIFVGTLNGVSVLNPTTYAVVTTIPVSGEGAGVMAISPAGPVAGYAYVSADPTYVTDVALTINPATQAITNTITTTPTSIAVAPSGAYAGDVYISTGYDESVLVVNPATNGVVTINLPNGDFSSGLAVDPTGPHAGYIYVANPATNLGPGPLPGTVQVINPATNSVVETIYTGGTAGGGIEGVAASPTGPEAGDVYVTNPGSDTVSVIVPD